MNQAPYLPFTESLCCSSGRYGHPECILIYRLPRTGDGWHSGTGGRVLGSLGKEGRSFRAGLRGAGLGELSRSQGRRDDDKGNQPLQRGIHSVPVLLRHSGAGTYLHWQHSCVSTSEGKIGS